MTLSAISVAGLTRRYRGKSPNDVTMTRARVDRRAARPQRRRQDHVLRIVAA